jgi:hypothetical protein
MLSKPFTGNIPVLQVTSISFHGTTKMLISDSQEPLVSTPEPLSETK